jgi:formate-dependent nitrite reductase membrane component NrfD
MKIMIATYLILFGISGLLLLVSFLDLNYLKGGYEGYFEGILTNIFSLNVVFFVGLVVVGIILVISNFLSKGLKDENKKVEKK